MKKTWLLLSHTAVLLAGFSLGIYLLPILTAPMPPSPAIVQALAGKSEYRGTFRRNLAGSDLRALGEGEVSVGRQAIALMGKVAPGPDYKLYLVPAFVENEEQILRLKAQSLRVGDIKTFESFVVPVPDGVAIDRHTTPLVWRETFSEFITATKYR